MSPNNHRFTSDENFPDDSVKDAANYCRNPDNYENGPWCYLAETTGYEVCGIPYCATTGNTCHLQQVIYVYAIKRNDIGLHNVAGNIFDF